MGGCAKNDKGKDGKDKDKDGKDGNTGGTGVLGLLAMGTQGFEISAEKHIFQVTLSGSKANEEPAKDLLDRHLKHLTELAEAGKLDSCAAAADGAGGIQLIVAESTEQALEIAASDPLVKEGFYKTVQVTELLRP